MGRSHASPGSTAEPPFLTAHWSCLAMLQYEVDPAVLRPLVPQGTQLDDWHGRALVSVVGFRFLQTRVLGVAIPYHRHFTEVNLRFYVRRPGPEGWRRGVVFIREVVPRRAIALVARLCYNEPYIALPMRHAIAMDEARRGARGRVRYEWRHEGNWSHLELETDGLPHLPAPASEEEFIAEHYWGYTGVNERGSLEYKVVHAPWQVWAARPTSVHLAVKGLHGPRLTQFLSVPPYSAFLADGSDVAVFRGRRVRGGL